MQTQAVAVAIANKDFDRAVSLRDPEFADCLHAFRATTRLNKTYRVPKEQRMRIGIIQCVNPFRLTRASADAPPSAPELPQEE